MFCQVCDLIVEDKGSSGYPDYMIRFLPRTLVIWESGVFGREEESEMKRTEDVSFYCDDLSDLFDLLLSTGGPAEVYRIRHDHAWIGKVGDEGLMIGLRKLNGKQLAIIEGVLFDDRSIIDIAHDLCIAPKEARMQIRKMRQVLKKYA